MRLINIATLELEEFFERDIPEYAILSHTWGREEVSFRDWADPQRRSAKLGYAKIEGACREARNRCLLYLWVDTCCIDKSSSADLSEAINSMFAWYRDAAVCLAFLEDVPAKSFHYSRWFTRGWTLQELLAPTDLVFFSQSWAELGSRDDRAYYISVSTGIAEDYIRAGRRNMDWDIRRASIACRMSWLSGRTTTRSEDMAYCMLGIFDIHIPLLYGEGGRRAFVRLQEEIIKVSNDQSIFCWSWDASVPPHWPSMLSPSPATFAQSAHYSPYRLYSESDGRPMTYSVTNAGLHIRLPVIRASRYLLAALRVSLSGSTNDIAIPLGYLAYGNTFRDGANDHSDSGTCVRMSFPASPVCLPSRDMVDDTEHDLYIPIWDIGVISATPPLDILPYDTCPGMVVLFNMSRWFKSVESIPAHHFNSSTSVFLFRGPGISAIADGNSVTMAGGFLKIRRPGGDIVILLCHSSPSSPSSPSSGGSRGSSGSHSAQLWHAQVMPQRYVTMNPVELESEVDVLLKAKSAQSPALLGSRTNDHTFVHQSQQVRLKIAHGPINKSHERTRTDDPYVPSNPGLCILTISIR